MPRLALTLMLTVVAFAGCARAPHGKTPSERSPTETLEQIIALRAQRQYGALAELVVSEQAHHLSAFLMKSDRFIDANARLCDLVRDHIAVGLARTVDQSYLAAALDIFGPRVELLDEKIEGDVATVTFMVDGRVPPRTATLRRVDGRWRYDPGAGFTPLLVEAFSALADGLEHVGDEISRGHIDPDDVLRNEEVLIRRVQASLRRGAELLSRARSEAGAAGKTP